MEQSTENLLIELAYSQKISTSITLHHQALMQLRIVLERTKLEISSLQNLMPAWDSRTDLRITTLGKFQMILQSTELSLYSTVNDYSRKDWFQNAQLGDGGNVAHVHYLEGHNLVTSIAFWQTTFSTVENFCRALLRAIDPTAGAGGTSAFESIYLQLYITKLNNRIIDAVELLNLSREIRNIIHNNGVYISKDGTDKSIEFRGQQYNFIHGRPIVFANWDFLIRRFEDLLNLMVTTVQDPIVTAIPSMRDPIIVP